MKKGKENNVLKMNCYKDSKLKFGVAMITQHSFISNRVQVNTLIT